MKKLWTVICILLVMVIFACDSGKSDKKKDEKKGCPSTKLEPYDGNPVLLRYKLEAGDVYEYTFSTVMEMDLGAYGEMTVTMAMEGGYEVEAVYEDGNMLTQTIIEKVAMEIEGIPGAEASYNSDNPEDRENWQYKDLNKLIDQPVPVLITPTGEFGDMEANPHTRSLVSMSNLYGNQTIDQLIEGTFQQLCEDPVTVGDTYEGGEFTMPSDVGEMDFKFSYLIKSISEDERYVVMVPVAEVDGEMISEVDICGEIVFDAVDGMADKAYLEIFMTMEIEGQEFEVVAEMNFEMKD